MAPPYVCLVSVHGIGFQQPPDPRTSPPAPGYADELHKRLKKELGDALGDDWMGRGSGPVYVQSEWEHSREKGLWRLGQALTKDQNAEIVHVALVYSATEAELGPQLGNSLALVARGAASLTRYCGLGGLVGILGRTIAGVVRQGRATQGTRSTLTPRVDVPGRQHSVQRLAAAEQGEKPPPKTTILLAIEQDIAAYVGRNDLRERLRGFVQQALQALMANPEVSVLVINAHSQGTVLCWDVLCRLPFSDASIGWAKRILTFVTAGSPIRKYVDLVFWGERVGQMQALSGSDFAWHNFWDDHDPVADPLDPPASWRPGQPTDAPRDPDDPTLLVAIDPVTGDASHFTVEDQPVDNVKNSDGGGLQAHDYWNNQSEFVAPLATLLRAAAGP